MFEVKIGVIFLDNDNVVEMTFAQRFRVNAVLEFEKRGLQFYREEKNSINETR